MIIKRYCPYCKKDTFRDVSTTEAIETWTCHQCQRKSIWYIYKKMLVKESVYELMKKKGIVQESEDNGGRQRVDEKNN